MLTTVAKVQNALRFTGSDQADSQLIERLIKEVQSDAETITRRYLIYGIYTEKFNGEGQKYLYLKGYPIISVESVSVDGSVIDSSYYEIDYKRGIIHYPNSFPSGFQNIVVVYVCGYESKDENSEYPPPDDLEGAIINEVVARYLYLQQVSLSGEGTVVDSRGFLDKKAMETILRYRRVLV
ncbi:hypothetical protein J7K25_00945 [bacterium]|nr:hypothetical protein [bacterium]